MQTTRPALSEDRLDELYVGEPVIIQRADRNGVVSDHIGFVRHIGERTITLWRERSFYPTAYSDKKVIRRNSILHACRIAMDRWPSQTNPVDTSTQRGR